MNVVVALIAEIKSGVSVDTKFVEAQCNAVGNPNMRDDEERAFDAQSAIATTPIPPAHSSGRTPKPCRVR